MTQFLQDKEHKFHEAATKLQMKISFEAHDFYAGGCFLSQFQLHIICH